MSMDSSEITCGGSDDGHEMNPFASFAFGGGASEPPTLAARPPGAKRKKNTDCVATPTTVARTGEKPEKKKGCKAENVGELSPEELRVFRKRWRGMADRGACVEDQRFQVLVGAVLSSRAQVSVVDEGLSRLRARSGGLTAAEMAEVGQDDLADVLRHVHWNKAKAKHIRESASIIVRRHRGVVPRRRAELLALPGVGPALVEILLNVFDSWDKDDKTESGRQLVDLTGGVDGDSTDRDGGDDKGPSHGERIKDEEPTTQRKRIEDQDGEDGKQGADQGVTGPEPVKNDIALVDEDAPLTERRKKEALENKDDTDV
ncbi:conserved unknown protein [Ectocarpus siliculosus]|uniref:HhH-GPD domain-containing protein n=1 Tax=Ectocarpus siliculosus TaxID=2880 RepID=D7FJW7_ECTSI|nr:conserved unknown protein [Ectocarpus siliculosus]|eukprot:CBJ29215.1 conserved unknown protein [Ectocarpus siliculosus]